MDLVLKFTVSRFLTEGRREGGMEKGNKGNREGERKKGSKEGRKERWNKCTT